MLNKPHMKTDLVQISDSQVNKWEAQAEVDQE